MTRLLLTLMCFVACAAAAPARADFGNCADPAYVRLFDARLTAPSCEQIATFTIRSSAGGAVPMRVLRPRGTSHGADTLMIRHVEALATRLGPAMDAIGRLRLMPVSVMLTDLTEAERAHGLTSYRSDGARINECTVTMYKLGGSVTVEEFVFTYAHEIFHCIQYATWLHASVLPDADWWVEGTAEYFSHLVQQGTRHGDDFFAAFDSESNTKSLLEMTYGNVVLFLWLHQQSGAPAIRTFIEQMPRSPGRPAQLSALQRAVPFGPWRQFGQEYFDGKVRQPGGRVIPLPRHVARAALSIRSSGSHTFPTSGPYVLTRREVIFEKGRAYGLTLTRTTPSVDTRMTLEADSLWDKPPPRVTACDANKIYRVITTSTEGAGNNELRVEASDRIAEGACCLIGKWSPTPATLNERVYSAGPPGMMGGGTTCRFVGGTWVLGFEENGNGGVHWKNFSTECRAPASGIVGQRQENGLYEFKWRYEGDHVSVTYVNSTLIDSMKLSVAGVQAVNQREKIELPPEPLRKHGIVHVCRDDSLQVKGLLTLPAIANHSRVPAER